ncbi:FCD domain-containing protein [Pseudomonas chlororaphis]|uniref:FCD domain-containing protein n=2 Tax=Pseudomonas chlororaphis TaxID=587753 RepID=A0AB34C6M1_9PSED|nr:FCD domain-containing protein [Pseudomonas chlororaphis]
MASQLEARVRLDIISGKLVPGSKLRLKDLAESYDAGVIPLREALSRLSTTGFVTSTDQKGFSVGLISAKEISDITNTRLHLECKALELSIQRGDLDWESKIIAAHHCLDRLQMMDAKDRLLSTDWENAHEVFHSALLSNCGSPWLLRFADLLRDQTARYRALSTQYTDSSGRNVPSEHRELMDAVLARDVETACAVLTRHYQTTTQHVMNHALGGQHLV